jgi:hypothetical protein
MAGKNRPAVGFDGQVSVMELHSSGETAFRCRAARRFRCLTGGGRPVAVIDGHEFTALKLPLDAKLTGGPRADAKRCPRDVRVERRVSPRSRHQNPGPWLFQVRLRWDDRQPSRVHQQPWHGSPHSLRSGLRRAAGHEARQCVALAERTACRMGANLGSVAQRTADASTIPS